MLIYKTLKGIKSSEKEKGFTVEVCHTTRIYGERLDRASIVKCFVFPLEKGFLCINLYIHKEETKNVEKRKSDMYKFFIHLISSA